MMGFIQRLLAGLAVIAQLLPQILAAVASGSAVFDPIRLQVNDVVLRLEGANDGSDRLRLRKVS